MAVATTLRYCSQCMKHTPHRDVVNMYSSLCTICNSLTSTFIRLQAEQHLFTAPDGTQATVVDNNPTTVTFYVASGQHKGYYHHDKLTGENRIVAG